MNQQTRWFKLIILHKTYTPPPLPHTPIYIYIFSNFSDFPPNKHFIDFNRTM